METGLDMLLQDIDPIRTVEDVAARVDKAINTFRFGSGIVSEWGDFKNLLTGFTSHVQSVILGMSRIPTSYPEIYWGRCIRSLIKEYGQNGEKAAFEIARTGVEGGIRAVMAAIGKRMLDEYSRNEITSRVVRFWEGLSTEEREAATDEYLKKYGHLLPSEITEKGALRVRASFIKVLEEHPHLIRRLRNAGNKKWVNSR